MNNLCRDLIEKHGDCGRWRDFVGKSVRTLGLALLGAVSENGRERLRGRSSSGGSGRCCGYGCGSGAARGQRRVDRVEKYEIADEVVAERLAAGEHRAHVARGEHASAVGEHVDFDLVARWDLQLVELLHGIGRYGLALISHLVLVYFVFTIKFKYIVILLLSKFLIKKVLLLR